MAILPAQSIRTKKYVQVRSSLEPVEPTEPTDPTDPTTPTDPTEPTDQPSPNSRASLLGKQKAHRPGTAAMALWLGLMLASCGGVLGMLFYRRKKAAAGK